VAQKTYEFLSLWKLFVIMFNKVPFQQKLERRKGQVPAALFTASFAYWVRLLNSLISTICWEPTNNAAQKVILSRCEKSKGQTSNVNRVYSEAS